MEPEPEHGEEMGAEEGGFEDLTSSSLFQSVMYAETPEQMAARLRSERESVMYPEPEPQAEPEPEPREGVPPQRLAFTHHGPRVQLSESGTHPLPPFPRDVSFHLFSVQFSKPAQACIRQSSEGPQFRLFAHFLPIFPHFHRLDARNSGITARSPGADGKNRGKPGEMGVIKSFGAPGSAPILVFFGRFSDQICR